jgi:hypothetical protein
MTLRPCPKAIDNLRLANLRDYIISEDCPEQSPFTSHFPLPSARLVPRRVLTHDDDTVDDIVTSFRKFTFARPKVDGVTLLTYRRFTFAMTVPTTEAMVPWVEWCTEQLGWEREWILENPVATKREIVRRFEGDVADDRSFLSEEMFDEMYLWEEGRREGHGTRPEWEVDEMRGGAVSRTGFRDEEAMPSSRLGARLRKLIRAGRPSTRNEHGGWEDEMVSRPGTAMGARFKSKGSDRPTSALRLTEMGTLKRQLANLKRKALTNPWQRRKNEDTKSEHKMNLTSPDDLH